jgi:Lrp/AsnC family transcriptional regulator, leucine-responsive regulatory protein
MRYWHGPFRKKRLFMAASLDSIDILILQLLQHDARLTNKEIADKLSKSVTSVYDRIRRLENSGYIRGYVALLDKERIGKNLTGFITVQLKEHSQTGLKAFQKEVVKFQEVMECYQLTGQSDFLIKVAIRDMQEYNDFLMNKLSTLPNIGVVQTSFVLSEAKHETAYPLLHPPRS